MKELDSVWVFFGVGGRFASAVFATLEDAEAQIEKHHLSGMLTRYPVGMFVLDWAVMTGYFQPNDKRLDNPNIQRQTFASAALEHYHYENGAR